MNSLSFTYRTLSIPPHRGIVIYALLNCCCHSKSFSCALLFPIWLSDPSLTILSGANHQPPLLMQERLFFISDLHAPYEDRRAVGLMFDALEHYQPHTVVIMGDFIDCLSVSHFAKDPVRVFGLHHEVEYVQALLDRIHAQKKIYIAGNHEDRLQRYLMDKAPEIMPFVNIPDLLGLEERGWEYVPYKHSTTIGKLHITHDVGSAGRYNVYRALDTFQASVATGHTHRLAYIVEGDATGGRQVSAQFGWLGDFEQVDYMHRVNALRNWAHGFGTGVHDTKTGYVYLRPHPIVDYTCEVDGTIFIRRLKKKPRQIESRAV